MTQINNDYIMLPTVDFCFKELMQNPKVRQGFIAALLKVDPKVITETTLLPTILSRDSADDKFGILDVRVKLVNGTQIDMEMQVAFLDAWQNRILFYLCKMYTEQMKKGDDYNVLQKCLHVSILDFNHFPDDEECYRTITLRDNKTGELYSDLLEIQILELKKLPKQLPKDDDIISWMKFFSGKRKEDFQKMADTNEYISEAYDTLIELSADEKKRLEYEAREKAIRDYNAGMSYARKRGEEVGMAQGIEKGLAQGIEKGLAQGIEKGLAQGIEKGLAQGIEKGLAQGIEKGMAQGIEKGIEKGMEKKSRDLIYKWTDKNVPVSEIADRLDWTEEEVRKVLLDRPQN